MGVYNISRYWCARPPLTFLSRPPSRHRCRDPPLDIAPPKKRAASREKQFPALKKKFNFSAPGTYYYLKYLANESQLVVSGGDTLSFQKSMPMLSPHTYGVPLPKSNQVLRLQSGCAEAHPTAARSTHVVSTVTFLVDDFHSVSPHREPRFQPKIA